MLDRFGVKQSGSIVEDTSKWPGGVTAWIARTETAIAPVAALPTTAAHFVLYNPSSSIKTLVVLRVGTIITTSAGAAINLGLAATLTTALVSSISGTAASAILPVGASTAAYGGAAQVKSAVTIVDDGLWHSVAPQIVCANTATLMLETHEDVAGLYYVKPGQQFCLASLCNAAGSAVCKPWVIFMEAQFAT